MARRASGGLHSNGALGEVRLSPVLPSEGENSGLSIVGLAKSLRHSFTAWGSVLRTVGQCYEHRTSKCKAPHCSLLSTACQAEGRADSRADVPARDPLSLCLFAHLLIPVVRVEAQMASHLRPARGPDPQCPPIDGPRSRPVARRSGRCGPTRGVGEVSWRRGR